MTIRKSEELLTVVIVNYNTADFIKVSLLALDKLTKNKYKVFICDNGSSFSDRTKLKKISRNYKNVKLVFRRQSRHGSYGHAEALNILIDSIDTPYGVILDSDATVLLKNWDEILIKNLDNEVKIIGAPITDNPIKPTNFPLTFCVLFETETFKSLKIDMRPVDIKKGLDTGWQMREKFLKNGLKAKVLTARNTRTYHNGPFNKVFCSEYYVSGNDEIFASHFGRGAALGITKYKEWNKLLMLYGINSVARKVRGYIEKKQWLAICREIIKRQEAAEGNLPRGYEYVVCDLCGKDNPTVILRGKDLYNKLPGEFKLVKCQECGFVYTNPRPYGEELSKYYPNEAGYFVPTLPKEGPAKDNKPMHVFRNKVLAAYMGYVHLTNVGFLEKLALFPLYVIKRRLWLIDGLPRYQKKGRLLEIGCSYGSYLKEMKDLGWEVVGIEPKSEAAEFGNKELGVRIYNGGFDDTEIDEKFDVIAMRMALEHFPSPSRALQKARRLLKEEGQLIIIIPDFSGIEYKLFRQYCYGLHLPAHLNQFTPLIISRYCQKYGFKIDKIIHHKFDRDFVASAQYLKSEGVNNYLAAIFSNKLFRRTILRVIVTLLSYLGLTSRMTVWVKKQVSN